MVMLEKQLASYCLDQCKRIMFRASITQIHKAKDSLVTKVGNSEIIKPMTYILHTIIKIVKGTMKYCSVRMEME